MSDTPRDYTEALAYARQQSARCNPPPAYGSTWHNDCQAFCHCAYGLFGGGFGSAYAQWLGLRSSDRHVTSDLSRAPAGAMLFSKGSTPFGHIWLAARPFGSGTSGSWSTDMVRYGQVDKVPRTAPRDHWGHRILGWGTSINGYELDLTHGTGRKPKPIHNKRYQFIGDAITRMEKALEVAKKDKDAGDIKMIQAEIARLKRMYAALKHA